jgi:formyltetrahydrofolate hydrolase
MHDIQLPVIAAFYALVSLYLPGPLYLYYTAGLTLAAVLWLESAGPTWRRAIWGVVAVSLTIVAVAFHAGQSRHRTPTQILAGALDTDVWRREPDALPRATIHVGRSDHAVYRRFIRRIESESLPTDTMLVLPNNAELYFLARRANVSRFYNSTMGLMTERDVQELLTVIRIRKPRLVIFRPDDKFVTAQVHQVMSYVKVAYDLIDTIDGADVYRLRGV